MVASNLLMDTYSGFFLGSFRLGKSGKNFVKLSFGVFGPQFQKSLVSFRKFLSFTKNLNKIFQIFVSKSRKFLLLKDIPLEIEPITIKSG